MPRIQVQKVRRTSGSRPASVGKQALQMDCRDLDVVRAKGLQRERAGEPANSPTFLRAARALSACC